MTRTLIFACTFASSALYSHADDQALKGMIERVTPGLSSRIEIASMAADNGKETFVINSKGSKLSLAGSSTAAKTAAFGWYLKHLSHSHFSWGGDRLNSSLALPSSAVQQTTPYRYRFAYNYCTLSYTMAFWDWQRWQREIDFLALNGYSHALVTAGLEKVWQETLRELGYPEKEIMKFIPNPAFAAWWNMGNLEGHGGPMTQGLIDREAELGRKIATRMRELGITPTLAGFVGILPRNIGQYNPQLQLVPQGDWVGFARPTVLDPTSDAFKEVAAIWYRNLHKIYGGPSKAYAGDLFHEGGRHGNIDVTAAAKSVQVAMQKASPESIWVLQSWQANPSPALVFGTDPKKTMILQLCRDMSEGTNGNLRTYQGRPWLWSELANFGGNHGLYGGNKAVSSLPSLLLDATRNRGDMAGVALLSEGIETNPFYYSLFFDSTWRTEDIQIDSWISKYALRRYGQENADAIKSLQLLNSSVYAPVQVQEGPTETILSAKPNRNAQKASTWSSSRNYYSYTDVLEAAESLLAASTELGGLETYRYDLTDVTRQVLSDLARPTLEAAMESYDRGDKAGFKKYCKLYLDLIEDTDELLASDSHWLLGTWLERAKAKGKTSREKRLMEVAARRQITTWSDRSDSLDEYSHRQWAGLMSDYYYPRWRSFFLAHLAVLEGQKPAHSLQSWYADQRMQEDLAWSLETKKYATKPTGDTVAIARKLLKKYAPHTRDFAKVAAKTAGFPWRLTQSSQDFSFDVNEHILSAGSYEVTVQYESGTSALRIHSVALYEGEKKVAEDVHEGWTGVENRQNIYRINLRKLRTSLDSYRLRVNVSAVSSIDSAGVLSIRKKE